MVETLESFKPKRNKLYCKCGAIILDTTFDWQWPSIYTKCPYSNIFNFWKHDLSRFPDTFEEHEELYPEVIGRWKK
jgi:hypothetical protein